MAGPSSEELRFILRMRDEASKVLQNAGYEVKGVGDAAGEATGQLDSLVSIAKEAAVAIAGIGASTKILQETTGAWGDYELGLIGVVKTTDFAGKSLDDFRSKFDDLDATMAGVDTQALQGIAEAAGQMGVKGVDDVVAFTDVLGKLSVTTDVVGQEGAASIARVLNLTKEGAAGVKQFGDVLNYLGNNSAATESEILQMATRLAQTTAEFGVGSKEILAFSAAAKELGAPIEVTGTAAGKVLRTLRDGLSAGTDGFKNFLNVANMTADEFQTMLKEHPEQVLIRFAQSYAAMANAGGGASFLDSIGLNSDEIKMVFGVLGQNTETFQKKLAAIGKGDYLGALNKEAEKFGSAQDNQLDLLGKRWTTLKALIGEALAPLTSFSLSTAIGAVNGLIDAFNALPDSVKTVVAVALTLGPAIFGAVAAARLLLALLTTIGAGSLFAPILAAVGKLRLGFQLVGVAATGFIGGFREGIASALGKSVTEISAAGVATKAATLASKAWSVTTADALKGIVTGSKAMASAVVSGGRVILASMVTFSGATLTAARNIITVVRNLNYMKVAAVAVGAATTAMKALRAAAVAVAAAVAAIPGLIAAVPAMIAAIPAAIGTLVAGVGAAVSGIVAAIASAPVLLVVAIAAALVAIAAAVYAYWDDITAFFDKSFAEMGQSIINTVTGVWDDAISGITNKWTEFMNWFTGETADNAQQAGKSLMAVYDQPAQTTNAPGQLNRPVQPSPGLSEDEMNLVKGLDTYRDAVAKVTQQEKVLQKLRTMNAAALANAQYKPEDVARLTQIIGLEKQRLEYEKQRLDPLFEATRALKDQIDDAHAFTGSEKSALEVARQIRDIAEQTGVSYDEASKRVGVFADNLQRAKSAANLRDLLSGYLDQIEAAQALTVEAQDEANIRKTIRDYNKDNNALDAAGVAAIRDKVSQLREAQKASVYADVLRSYDQQLAAVQAITNAEKDRAQIVQAIVDFEKQNGTLGAQERQGLAQKIALLATVQRYQDAINSYDPVGTAKRQYDEEVKTLDAMRQQKVITEQQYALMRQNLDMQSLSARNPVAARIKSAREELAVLKLSNREGEIEQQVIQEVNSLKEAGVNVTKDMTDAMREYVTAVQDANKAKTSGFGGFVNEVGTLEDNLNDLEKNFANGLSDAITDALTGRKTSFADFAASFGKMFISMAVKRTLASFFDSMGARDPQQAAIQRADAALAKLDALSQAGINTPSAVVNAGQVTVTGLDMGQINQGVAAMQPANDNSTTGKVTTLNPNSWGLRGSVAPASPSVADLGLRGSMAMASIDGPIQKAIAQRTSAAVDAASKMIGASETANRSQVNAFLREGGVNIDAAQTAWCAGFVNSSLKQVGVDGSGKLNANSFLNWGQGVDPRDVMKGDVLVNSRGLGANQTGGHVGFATGNTRMSDAGLQLEMLSGNTSNKVDTGWYNASQLNVRRATDQMAQGMPQIDTSQLTAATQQVQTSVQQLGTSAQTAATQLQSSSTTIGTSVTQASSAMQIAAPATTTLSTSVQQLGPASTTAAGQVQTAAGQMQTAAASAGTAASTAGQAQGGFSSLSSGLSGLLGPLNQVIPGLGSFGSAILSLLGNLGGAGGGGGGGLFSGLFSLLGFADGGKIKGPGTGRQDNLLAAVSNGEFVVNAKATKAHEPLLQAINSGASLAMGQANDNVPAINVTRANENSLRRGNDLSSGLKMMQDNFDRTAERMISGFAQASGASTTNNATVIQNITTPDADSFRRSRAQTDQRSATAISRAARRMG